MDVLAGLNPRQEEAVLQTDGPVLVLAGAGSGKTRVIVHRIAYLLDGGIAPWRILAVTFTNKAADEMRNRTLEMVGEGAEKVWLCTFHSLCARILRVHIEKLEAEGGRTPFRSGFSIYSEDDAKRLISQCIKDLGLEYTTDTVKQARRWISYSKLRGMGPDELETRLARDGQSRVAAVYEQYLLRAAASNAVDFDDLLALTLRLLDENEEVRDYYQDRFEYCMVDEFQDTNRVQYDLMKRIADKHRNLLVVGDDDQSIYSFRGADIRNILEFERDYPDAQVVHLDQNYRSTQNILSTASCLIAKNLGRKVKSLFTRNVEGARVEFCTCASEQAEAEFVCNEILKLRRSCDPDLSRMAVLYRTNAQSRAVEDVLLRCQVPYTIVRGLRFYERKEVRDVIAYLKTSLNPDDDMALSRIINVPPRGIGKLSLERINTSARGQGCSLYQAMADLAEAEAVKPALRRKLKSVHSLLESLKTTASSAKPAAFVGELLRETGYLEYLLEGGDESATSRAENVEELVTVAKSFEKRNPEATLEDFAHHIALMSELDDFHEEESPVSLLTLHSAKGLEFDVVFVIGVESGLLPHYSVQTKGQIEEERRLLYVGMTRAKRMLILTRAWRRLLFGKTTMNPGSPFVDEISGQLLAHRVYYGDGPL